MKKIAIALIVIASSVFSSNMSAQGKFGADSADCVKYLSYYKEYFKQKSYNEALPNWRKAYHYCPATANQYLLIDGATLMRKLINENAKNTIYKNELVDTLLTLHQKRAQYYPKYKETALNNMAVDMSNYIKDDNKKLYEGYTQVIAENQAKTKPTIFLFNFKAAVELYNEGSISAEDVINLYQNSMALLDKEETKTPADAEQLASVKTDMESLFITSKVASCENLLALFTPRYEANPDDVDLLSKIVKMMSTTEGCQDNDLFLSAVTKMYKVDPSYTSAYYLFKLNSSRGNVADAVKYMEEAIAYPESDDVTDGEYNYELATFLVKSGQGAKGYNYARKSIDLNPSMAGKAYFLMGTIWAGTGCGGDEIARRAPYWVAVDYFQKAKAADESLTDEANRMIGAYSGYFPTTADAFMYNLTNGQSYTVSCGGISASTTVRTRNN